MIVVYIIFTVCVLGLVVLACIPELVWNTWRANAKKWPKGRKEVEYVGPPPVLDDVIDLDSARVLRVVKAAMKKKAAEDKAKRYT